MDRFRQRERRGSAEFSGFEWCLSGSAPIGSSVGERNLALSRDGFKAARMDFLRLYALDFTAF
jgi:hypothetical protein